MAAVSAGAAALSSAVWTASKTTAGAAGVAYTYTVMAATASTLSDVTMTVPAGTSGTPVVGTVTPASITSGKSIGPHTVRAVSFRVTVPAGAAPASTWPASAPRP